MPRVSVLMTIYNAEKYLNESIDSLLAQTFIDWELIAVENGSNDNSLDILNKYEDQRIKVFSLSKNIGRTPALRYAFEKASGEYLAVLDADDVSDSSRFKLQVELLDFHSDISLVASWAKYIDHDSKVFDTYEPPVKQDEVYDCLGWTNPIVHSSAMFRKSLAKEVGGYPEKYIFAQDYGLILRLLEKGSIRIIPKYLCQFRVLSKSMTNSSQYSLIVAREGKELLEYAAEKLTLSVEAMNRNKRSIAICEIKISLALIKKRELNKGLNALLKGILRDPTAIFFNGKVNKMFSKIFKINKTHDNIIE